MRQLNKKTPRVFYVGVALLMALLISSHMITGLYAKFITATDGDTSDTARVAKIDVDVFGDFFGYTLTDVNFDSGDVYAIIQDFTVVNSGEVSYNYNLRIRLSNDIATASFENPVLSEQFSFDAPSETISSYLYDGENKNAGLSVVSGRGYYAVSSDGINYTWREVDVAEKEEIVIQPLSTDPLTPDSVHYYRTVYFVVINTGLANGELLNSPQMTLFYNIVCEQVD